METSKNISNSKTKAFLLIIGIMAAIMLIFSLLLHLTPLGLLEYVEDFAVHHYFLMALISIVVLAASIKAYSSLNEKIDQDYRERHSFELSRVRRKRIKSFNLFKSKQTNSVEDESCIIKINEINNLSFSQTDVLVDEEAKLQRLRDIQKATILGNSHKHKIIILFKSSNAKHHIITTIWQSTAEHITLKGGIILPVKNIYKIEL